MEIKPLNILLIASWYPDDLAPSQGSFIEEQAVMLQQRGHSVTVLHAFLLGTFKESMGKKEVCEITTRKNITVIRVGVKPILPGSRKLAYSTCFKRSLSAFKKFGVDPESFDVVHSHAAFMGGIITLKLSQKYNLEFFHTEHTSGLIFLPEQYNQQDRLLLKKVYSRAKNVFFVSRFALDNSLKTFNIPVQENILVLHNVVDDSFFNVHLNKIPAPPLKYIAINNLIPRKGVDNLIYAWSQLIKEYPNSLLTIAGSGSMKDDLQKMVAQIGLSNNVSFIPSLNRQEVIEALNSHHVLVSASYLETFGLTVAEAQAMGKPVVVTDSGGVRDIVESETGIITDQTVESFAKGLIEIQKNYIDYSPDSIRAITRRKFSFDIVYTKLYTLYLSSLKD
jgi:glycogen(starch) synthase